MPGVREVWWRYLQPWRLQYVWHKQLVWRRNFPEEVQKYRVIFIHIPKTAGTALKKHIPLHRNAPFSHFPLSILEKALPNPLDHYFKFTFVRHPVTRLHSAFWFLKGGGFKDWQEDALFAKYALSQFSNFNEFIDWLSPRKRFVYIHFYPQTFFIKNRAGQIAMDFIGRQEHFQEDLYQLVNKLREWGYPVEPPQTVRQHNVTRQKPPLKLDARRLQKIYELYREDFDLLGYDPERF